MTGPVLLRPVVEVADRAAEIVAQLADELSLLSPTLDVQHVGATSLGAGITKGDVDVAVRVPPSVFAEVVAALKLRFGVAQPQNWTPTYASFTDQRWDLPVGLQVCVVGSPDDFLVALRNLFLREPTLRERYDSVKRQAAGHGPDAYWRAKDAFLRELLTRRGLRRAMATAPCCLVLVNGVPGAGKTTVARQLADHFRWPLISKDAFKELIFDGLGWSTKDWSLKLSATAHRLMDSVIQEQLGSGHSVVVESNFKPEIDSARFENLCSAFAAVPVQVLCWADPDVLFDRYWARQTSKRHPGHVETATKEEQRRGIGTGRSDPLRISGPTIEVDTTNFDRIDYPRLFDTLRAITGQAWSQPLSSGVSGETAERVRAAWREMAGVPRDDVARTLVVAEPAQMGLCPSGWVGVVACAGDVIVTAPSELLRSIEVRLRRALDDRLTDPHALDELLGPFQEQLGPAALLYADALIPVEAPDEISVEPSDQHALRRLTAGLNQSEIDESGVEHADVVFLAYRLGDPVAAAGYQRWPGGLAHLGVLTNPRFRRQGIAEVVSRAAAEHALANGLVPQWRAALSNEASLRTGRQLGFVELGRQLSISTMVEHTVRLGAFVAVFNERNEVLLVHRRDVDVWEAPGGNVETGEAPWTAAVREVLEETGLRIHPNRLVGLYWRPRQATLVFQFAATAPAETPTLSDETSDIAFFPVTELPENMTPVVRERLVHASSDAPPALVTQLGPTAHEFTASD